MCPISPGFVLSPADSAGRPSRLYVLMHNARFCCHPAETGEGHEITLASHVLGPVLLSEFLLPVRANSPDPRVIFMSSGGM